jgi:hypothetical protein
VFPSGTAAPGLEHNMSKVKGSVHVLRCHHWELLNNKFSVIYKKKEKRKDGSNQRQKCFHSTGVGTESGSSLGN